MKKKINKNNNLIDCWKNYDKSIDNQDWLISYFKNIKIDFGLLYSGLSGSSTIPNYMYLKNGEYAIAFATGSLPESAILKMNEAGLEMDEKVLATSKTSFSREGFVLGEGAGALVLEEYEYAKARGAKIYAEVIGGGMSSDAYHITAPHPEGIGVIAVMKNCLENSGIKPEDVDHINTHGTSTPLGDVAELKAISAVFGAHAKNININSTKSMTGHLLGAAGAIESIAAILAMKHSIVPPTINHQNFDENINPDLNLTLNKPQKREIKVAMSNTFGFGGHNACVAFKKIDE